MRAEAEVVGLAEVGAPDVELVGALEHRGVAGARALHRDDGAAPRDRHAADAQVLEHEARGAELIKVVEAEGLLHGGAGEGRVGAHALELPGVAQQVQEHEPQGVHGRVGAADDDGLDDPDELGLAEAPALLLDVDEGREHVVAGPLAALGEQGPDVAIAGREAADQRVALVEGQPGVYQQQARAREHQEAGLHRGRDREQPADHPQRDVVDHRREVDDLERGQPRERRERDLPDLRAQQLDLLRREARVHQPAQPQVVRRLDLKQAVLGRGPILAILGQIGERLVARVVAVRTRQPRVLQYRQHVLISTDQICIGQRPVIHRRRLAQLAIDRRRVVVEALHEGVEDEAPWRRVRGHRPALSGPAAGPGPELRRSGPPAPPRARRCQKQTRAQLPPPTGSRRAAVVCYRGRS